MRDVSFLHLRAVHGDGFATITTQISFAVPDVFLSYASEDREVAARLASQLEQAGVSVWWDRQLIAGHIFEDIISEQLDASKSVIVLWSSASINKEWVKAEANEGLNKKALIPVLISNVKPPLIFRRIRCASLLEWQGNSDHPGFQEILSAVSCHTGASDGLSSTSTGISETSNIDSKELSSTDATYSIANEKNASFGKASIGSVLKCRYQLLRDLGSGACGTVFRAVDRVRLEVKDPQPYVAVKVIHPALCRQASKSLRRQVNLVSKLAHPNIARVFDFDCDGELCFISMEYLEGRTLNLLDERKLTLQDILNILQPVASALEYAHDQGVYHLNIKPRNIWLTDRGAVKITGFAVRAAIFRSPEKSSSDPFNSNLLCAHSPLYASTDVLEGLLPDPREDVFSLGLVVYELLTGRHPFGHFVGMVRAEGLTPEKPRQLTSRQWRALANALALDRAKRTASVKLFYQEFSRSNQKEVFIGTTALIGILVLILCMWLFLGI